MRTCGGNKVGSDSPHLHFCECAIDYTFFQPRLGESSQASQIVLGFAMQREETRHHCLISACLCVTLTSAMMGEPGQTSGTPSATRGKQRLAVGEEVWCSDQMRSCELAMAHSLG